MPQGRKSSFFFGRKKDSTLDNTGQKTDDKKGEKENEKTKKSLGNPPEQQQTGIGKIADDLTGTAFNVLQSVIKETTRPKSSLIYSIHPTIDSTTTATVVNDPRPLENELKILHSSIALNMK